MTNTLLLHNFTYFYVAKQDPKVCNLMNTATAPLSNSAPFQLTTCRVQTLHPEDYGSHISYTEKKKLYSHGAKAVHLNA